MIPILKSVRKAPTIFSSSLFTRVQNANYTFTDCKRLCSFRSNQKPIKFRLPISFLLIVISFFFSFSAFCQNTNFSDPTVIITSVQQTFHDAIFWVIGAKAVILVVENIVYLEEVAFADDDEDSWIDSFVASFFTDETDEEDALDSEPSERLGESGSGLGNDASESRFDGDRADRFSVDLDDEDDSEGDAGSFLDDFFGPHWRN